MGAELDEILVGPTELGRWLNITDEWVRRLRHEGVFKRRAKGLYALRECVTAYVEWQRAEQRRSSKTAADSRLTDARAERERLKIARETGELIPYADSEAMLDETIGKVIEEIGGLGARITRDRDLRQLIDRECDAARTRLATWLQEKATEWRAEQGKPPR